MEIFASRVNNKGIPKYGKNIEEGKCIFPFKFNRKIWNDCIEGKEGKWCATQVDSNGKYIKYAFCPSKTTKSKTPVKKTSSSKKSKKNSSKNLKKNTNNAYVFYPDIVNDTSRFANQITKKKEFHQHSIKPELEYCKDKEESPDFDLMSHQLLLKNFISDLTPYNSLLIFHGTGIGKSCSAISITENFKDYVIQNNKKIILISSSKLKENFYKELFNYEKEKSKKIISSNVQCTGDSYALNSKDLKFYSKEQYLRRVKSEIRKYYLFLGYIEFANKIKKIQDEFDGNTSSYQKKIKKIFSNRIILIDEIHNIRTAEKNSDMKRVPPLLRDVIKYGENNKLIMMSATPMYNTPDEIIYLTNLLLLNDKRSEITQQRAKKIFDLNQHLTPEGEQILQDSLIGYVSYLRSEHPARFPRKIYPEDSKKSDTIFNQQLQLIPENDRLKYLNIVECPMLTPTGAPTPQYAGYKKYVEDSKQITEIVDSYGQIAIQVSNIIYPSNIVENGTYGKNGFEKILGSGKGAFTKIGGKQGQYIYQDHAKFTSRDQKQYGFLHSKFLNNYSCKLSKLLENIKKSKGIVYIYSEYIDGGILPIALMLENNGYERYNDKELLKDDNKEKAKKSPGKYVILTGDSSLSKLSPVQAANIINEENNKNGEKIKIILGTRVTGEGVDFKRIKEVHIIDPWHNMSRIDQIIGRAVRNCSHADLPSDEQNVKIFLYVSKLPTKNIDGKQQKYESIDHRIYRRAEQKDEKIRKVERLLKEISIDCILNKLGNVFDKERFNDRSDVDYSRECDYTKCDLKCKPIDKIKNDKINNSTYDSFYHSKHIINKIKKFILDLFSSEYIYNLNTIVHLVKKSLDDINESYIYYAINKILKSNIILKDQYNREGKIHYVNGYYVFIPLDMKFNTPPKYIRNPKLLIKKDIEIDTSISKNNTSNNTLLKKELDSNIIQKIENETDDIKLEILIEHIPTQIKISTLKNIIVKNQTVNKLNKFEQKFLSYHTNILIKNRHLNKKPADKVIGIHNKYKDVDKKHIITIEDEPVIFSKDSNKWINLTGQDKQNYILNSTSKKDTRSLSSIYGYLTCPNRCKHTGEKVFKVRNQLSEIKGITKEGKDSKRTDTAGQVCDTQDKKQISELYTLITKNKNEVIDKMSKNMLCSKLEYALRKKEHESKSNKNGNIWFLK